MFIPFLLAPLKANLLIINRSDCTPINIETKGDAYVFARDGQARVYTFDQLEMGDMFSSLNEY